jgi:CubicO group peptidase (beta-lactamase class C family)
MYDGALTPDLAVSTFRHIDRLFPTRTIARGDRVSPLPAADRALTRLEFVSRGKHWDLNDYLAVNRVAGLLVLKNGRVALEIYQYGNTPSTRWMSMSVAKSITSTLIGAAIRDGYIGSVDDPVTRYIPSLAGSAYQGVSIRDLLRMSSGVRWNETYTDPKSDRRRLLDVQIAQKPGAALDLMARLPRAAPPGTVNNYNTGETLVAGEVLHQATKRALSAYLSERIWKPVGMESDATWWLASPDGIEIAGSGISATLRDYARFGQFVLGGWAGQRPGSSPAGMGSGGRGTPAPQGRQAARLRILLVGGHTHSRHPRPGRGILCRRHLRPVHLPQSQGAGGGGRVERAIEARRHGYRR